MAKFTICLLPLAFFILNSFIDLLEDVFEACGAHVVGGAALPGLLGVCRALGLGRAGGGGSRRIVCTSHRAQADQVLEKELSYCC